MDESVDVKGLQSDALLAYQYAHNREDWITPLEDALAGITLEEATWKPTVDDARCIWEIVLHMTAWTDNVVQRMRGAEHGKPPEGAWPPLPIDKDATAWATANDRLWEALAALRTQIKITSPALLFDRTNPNGSLFNEVVCRFIHNAYHIGQITKLREFWTMQNRAA